MNSILKSIIWIVIVGLLSCKKEDNSFRFHLDSINKNKYYIKEIIPTNYLNIYGKWKLYKISGGFSGNGYEPDYDFLEIKRIGIYGLVKNDSLFEYGRIELDTFDYRIKEFLQIKLVSDYYSGLNPRMSPPEMYIDLKGTDTLNLISSWIDMYDYHYIRVK
jgi:hypothetical protein